MSLALLELTLNQADLKFRDPPASASRVLALKHPPPCLTENLRFDFKMAGHVSIQCQHIEYDFMCAYVYSLCV